MLDLDNKCHSLFTDVPNPAKPFSLSYIKGMGRSCSLLALLHLFKEWQVDIESEFPVLHTSILKVWGHCKPCGNKVDEGLENMRVSLRGSLRKAMNLIDIVIMLTTLTKDHGLADYTSFLKKWNTESPRQHQIVGRKAFAIKLLFEQGSADVIMSLMKHVSEYGWQFCGWSEEALSTKKLYEGFQFHAKNKAWAARLKTTLATTLLAIKRIHSVHSKNPPYMRKKADAARSEQVSERACAVLALQEELLQRVPLDRATVMSKWSEAWAEGSEHVDMEVQACLLDKRSDFDVVKDVSAFRQLIEDHIHHAPVTAQMPDADAIEIDRFALVMKQCAYDEQVYMVWVKKCQSAQFARAHAEHEWRITRRIRCKDAAQKFMDGFLKMTSFDGMKKEQCIAEVLNCKRAIQMKTGLNNTQQILSLTYWTSPTLSYLHHSNGNLACCPPTPIGPLTHCRNRSSDLRSLKRM